jgi:DNA replication protein DnaC
MRREVVCMLDFREFWNIYPRKVGRIKAEMNWRRMKPSEQVQAVRGVELWKQTVQWQGSGGIYIPYASTFLAQKRYLDEPWTGAFEEKS